MAKGSSSYSDFNALMQQLEQGEILPVYLLQGEEYRFLEQLLDKIEEKVVDPATASFNHHTFYGKETEASELVNLARRFPMMADKQLIVYKEAQYCRKPDEMEEYIKNPVPSTVLVWYHPGKKIPSNRKLAKAFAASGKVFNADPIAEKDVIQVVHSYIQEQGYDIEPKPLHLLVENSAARVSLIFQELDKVFSNIEKGSKIREDHIQKYVGINKKYNIFGLQKALAQKRRTEVVEILNYFTAHTKEYPLVVLNATLYGYFRKVSIVQSMTRSTDKEIMSAVGIPFFAMSEYREAARNYGGKKIVSAMDCINDCDLKFKGIKPGGESEKALLEETILKILSL
jgi:DNA polymerase-3 subunit delta